MEKEEIFNNDLKMNNFEKEIDNIIQDELNNIILINEYIGNNNLMNDIDKISDKSIILEEYNINIDNEYPDMKYFTKTKLPEEKDFKKEFVSLEENSENYPIINYILDDNSNIKYLKYLPTINELCNYIIKSYSYKFTREEAKKIKIKEEMEEYSEKIDKFINIYEKLRPLIKQYECHEFKDKKGNLYFNDLTNNQYLSNFCIDIGEFDYGMVLAALYKELINWQNHFINIVLNSKNLYYKNYSELFKQEIMIQDCTESDIIKFPSNKDIMNNIIIKNSYQKNYGVIHYNYQLIEEELASKILPSIKRFISNNDKCLRYIIYQFEGFRGNKSNIMTQYIEKYRTRELNTEELKIIKNSYNSLKNDNKKLTNFLFSLQILIDIILENNYDKNELISNIINQNDTNENINILKDLFKNNLQKKLFTVDSLINIFNIFEICCWDKIKNNLVENYLMDINDNIKNKINNFFSNKENKKIITKIKLSTAIRRYVSRYLSGKRGDIEINEKNNLMYYLSKQELWDEYGFVDNEEFEEELTMIFEYNESNSMICVGQATKLYEYLGGDNSLLNEYFGKLEENKPKIEENDKNEIIEEKKDLSQDEISQENEEKENSEDEKEVKEDSDVEEFGYN